MAAIIVLLALGLTLIIIELFVLMGTFKVGFLGLIVLFVAMFFTYSTYGAEVGHLTLGLTSVFTIMVTVAGIRYMQNNEVGLEKSIEGRVNEIDQLLVAVGDFGKAFGDLRLAGSAEINGKIHEVESEQEYIDDNSTVLVTRVTDFKIYVKEVEEGTDSMEG